MTETLKSVGIDIGTSTTQLVVSDLTLENRANPFSVPRIAITDKKIVYRSGIHEHAAIAEAIAHRDGALAAQRMREHLQNDYGPYLTELTAPQP